MTKRFPSVFTSPNQLSCYFFIGLLLDSGSILMIQFHRILCEGPPSFNTPSNPQHSFLAFSSVTSSFRLVYAFNFWSKLSRSVMDSYELSCYKHCLLNLLDIQSWCLELRLLCLEAVHLNYVLLYSLTNILCYSIRIEVESSWLYCRQTHSFYRKFVIDPWNPVFFNGLKSMVSFL